MIQALNIQATTTSALYNKGVAYGVSAFESLNTERKIIEKKTANYLLSFSRLFFSPYSMIQMQIHNKQHLYYIRRCSLWLEYLMLESLLGLFLSAAKVIKDIKTAKELKEKRQEKAKIFKKRQEVKKG